MSEIPLSELAVGETGRVSGYSGGNADLRRRLLAMGLTRGTLVTVTRVAPAADPIELRLRGFSMTMRRSEASALNVVREQGRD